MFGWLTLARILISFKAFRFSFSFRLWSRTFFNAYCWLSDVRLTRKTVLYEPSPSLLKIWKFFRDIETFIVVLMGFGFNWVLIDVVDGRVGSYLSD